MNLRAQRQMLDLLRSANDNANDAARVAARHIMSLLVPSKLMNRVKQDLKVCIFSWEFYGKVNVENIYIYASQN